MDADGYKQVSFSPEVEVRVFKPRPVTVPPQKLKGLKIEGIKGIKSRLGRNEASPSVESLHRVKKSVSMKAPMRSPPFTSRVGKMQSDNLKGQTFTVHSRLGSSKSEPKEGSSVFNRLGKN